MILLELSITEVPARLGVSRKNLSKIINGSGVITAEIVMRLELTFGKPDAAYWLRLQNAYDLLADKNRIPVKFM